MWLKRISQNLIFYFFSNSAFLIKHTLFPLNFCDLCIVISSNVCGFSIRMLSCCFVIRFKIFLFFYGVGRAHLASPFATSLLIAP
jgi:hypothetical protein